MRSDDARKLDHATLEAMRMRAVQRVQEGESPELVARILASAALRSIVGSPITSARLGRAEGEAAFLKSDGAHTLRRACVFNRPLLTSGVKGWSREIVEHNPEHAVILIKLKAANHRI
jgi:hypothetical protein